MGCYQFHDLVLDVQPADLESKADLGRLWSELSWRHVDRPDPQAARLVLRVHERAFSVPTTAARLFTTDSFCGFQQGPDFYLSDGESVLHLQPGCHADAYLA